MSSSPATANTTATMSSSITTTPTSSPSSDEHMKSLEDGTAHKDKIINRNSNSNNINTSNNTPHHHTHPQPASSLNTAADRRNADVAIDYPSFFANIFSRLKVPKLRHTKTIPTDIQKSPSTARAQSHLANERTYLAWVRSGITVIALGIACARFAGIQNTSSQMLVTTRSLASGGLLVALGGLMIIYGTIRYMRINRQLEKGYFIIGSRGIEVPICAFVILVVVLAAMILIFV